jgi:hypothetical protein
MLRPYNDRQRLRFCAGGELEFRHFKFSTRADKITNIEFISSAPLPQNQCLLFGLHICVQMIG